MRAQVKFQTQVLVVGAGPTGLTVANLLARDGHDILLIERGDGLSDLPKALFVDDEFYRLLRNLDLDRQFAADGRNPIDFKFFSPRGSILAEIPGRDTDNNFPNRTAIFQPRFEKLLLQGLQRFPRARVRFGCELEGFRMDADKVVASARDKNGETVEIVAEFLLGCDGAHSTVRKSLGIVLDEVVDFRDRHLVVDVIDENDRNNAAQLICNPVRSFHNLPTPVGRRFEFSMSQAEDAEKLLSDATLTELFKPYLRFDQLNVMRKTVYTFHARLARTMQQGRAFLLGDAAHLMPPFSSQGMNSGARDANNLAWKLSLYLDGKAGNSLLETYTVERRPQVRSTILMATQLGRLVNTRSRIVAALRDLVFGLLSLAPRLKKRFTETPYVPRPTFDEGVLVRLGDGDETCLGHILPHPRVSRGTDSVLLDEVLGPGFSLIGLDPPPEEIAVANSVDRIAAEIGARVVVLKRPGHDTTADDGAVYTVADRRLDRLFAANGGRWLLVRPDRVIAAATGIGELAAVARRLDAILGSPEVTVERQIA